MMISSASGTEVIAGIFRQADRFGEEVREVQFTAADNLEHAPVLEKHDVAARGQVLVVELRQTHLAPVANHRADLVGHKTKNRLCIFARQSGTDFGRLHLGEVGILQSVELGSHRIGLAIHIVDSTLIGEPCTFAEGPRIQRVPE